MYNADAVIDIGVGEQVGPHAFLLDLFGDHLPDVVGVKEQVPHLAVHLVVDNEVPGLRPVAVPHGLAGGHDVLPHALGGPTSACLSLILLLASYSWAT